MVKDIKTENIFSKEIDFNNWLKLLLRSKVSIISLALILISLGYYFFYLDIFHDFSAFRWLWNTWNPDADYEHAKFFPPVIAFLLFLSYKQIKKIEVKPENFGIFIIFFGIVLYILSIRTKQPRIAIVALPFILTGISYFLWGKKITRKLLFPFFLIILSIRMPGLEQATNSLQVFSSTIAYKFCLLLGIDLVQFGNNIYSGKNDWGFDISEGCSGIRSLMALSFIAAVYAHLTAKKLWQKVILFVSSVPISMIANSFRISTIVLVAEFIDKDFAANTYHDWSGLILFFPMGLFLLIIEGKFLDQGFSIFKSKVIHKIVSKEDPANIKKSVK